jgi:hypothetical protein
VFVTSKSTVTVSPARTLPPLADTSRCDDPLSVAKTALVPVTTAAILRIDRRLILLPISDTTRASY